jgi:hypothetical protein
MMLIFVLPNNNDNTNYLKRCVEHVGEQKITDSIQLTGAKKNMSRSISYVCVHVNCYLLLTLISSYVKYS